MASINDTTAAPVVAAPPLASSDQIRLAGLGLGVAVAYAPLLALHFQRLWAEPQYQYFPFIVAVIAYLLYARRGSTLVSRRPSVWLVGGLAAMAALLFVAAQTFLSPWLAMFSLILGGAAVIAAIERGTHRGGLRGPWLLTVLLLPLPLGLDDRLTQFLQRVSSRLSSGLLDELGVLHFMSGNTLQVSSKQFFVDEACSGIISLFSIIAVALVFAVWRRCSFLHTLLLVVMGVLVAVFLNVVRISLIAVTFDWYDVDLSSGAVHEVLSLAVFASAFGVLASLDVLLRGMLTPVDEEPPFGSALVRLWNHVTEPARPDQPPAPMPKTSARLVPSLATCLIVVLTAATCVGQYFARTHAANQPVTAEWLPAALQIDEDAMPQRIGRWKRVDYQEVQRDRRDIAGEFSRTYTYFHEGSGQTAVASIDFPFRDNHELTVCYQNTGWSLIARRVCQFDKLPRTPVVDARFVQSDQQQAGILLFALFNGRGAPVDPQPQAAKSEQPLADRLRSLFASQKTTVPGGAIQAQVWVIGPTDEADLARLGVVELLDEAGEAIVAALAASAPPGGRE